MNVVGVGTKIVECLRIAQMIERHGELFLMRVFTPREIEFCSTRKAATQHYSGRWAAKEAVLQAMGTGWRPGIDWRDIEIRGDGNSPPRVALGGGAREECERRGVAQMLLSISHCRTHATAYVLALGRDDRDDLDLDLDLEEE